MVCVIEEDGKLIYSINVQDGYIYEKMYEAEITKKMVLPLYTQTYWYNYTYRLPNVKADFARVLKEKYTKLIKKK